MGINAARRPIATLAALCGVAALAFGACGAPSRARHISTGCTEGRRIALTFDDGPNPPFTQDIVAILRERGATATFFLEGEAVEARPEIARDLVAGGMAVGAHSYAHARELPSLSAGAFRADLLKAERALSATMGFAPAIYRSPYGHTSNVMLEVERDNGYTSIGWDLDSTDWSDASVDDVVGTVLDGAHPGAIVLMHDGGLGGGNPNRATTVAALPRIIDGLRAAGYAFATVPEITGAPARQGETIRAACSTE